MKKLRFAEEQIIFALKQAELGTYVPDVCRKLGVSDATFYLWPPTTAHCDCASVKSSKPGSTMVTAGFTSCSGGRAGGIIINAFTGSTANRACPCVSNAHAGINRHSGDSPSLRGCIRIMSGVWTLSLMPYLTGVGCDCSQSLTSTRANVWEFAWARICDQQRSQRC